MVVEKAIADGLGLGIDVKNHREFWLWMSDTIQLKFPILSLGGIV